MLGSAGPWGADMGGAAARSDPAHSLQVSVLEASANTYLGEDTAPLISSCCSFTKSCLTLCDPTDGSTPGSSVLHCLPAFAHIHVH